LSHPCKTFPQKSKYPSTGYWIPKSNTGKIEKITFIFSPHSKNNNFREFRSEVEAIEYISRKGLDRLNVIVACNEIKKQILSCEG